VREEITLALRDGRLDGPTGVSAWSLLGDGPAVLTAEEGLLAERLRRGQGDA
jgi:hypothetical protein